jgi:hypothetical protein
MWAADARMCMPTTCVLLTCSSKCRSMLLPLLLTQRDAATCHACTGECRCALQ